jgi:hypothetical protein
METLVFYNHQTREVQIVNPISAVAWGNLFYTILTSYSNVLRHYSPEEHPEKNGWWINELESLGVDTKSYTNELKYKQDNLRFGRSYQADIYGRV